MYESKKIPHSQPVNLKNNRWALVYSNKNFNDANILFEMMGKAQGAFGIRVEEP
jgi:hypothetical protein